MQTMSLLQTNLKRRSIIQKSLFKSNQQIWQSCWKNMGWKKKIIAYVKDEIPPTLTNLINDNYGVVLKLSLLAFNKKKRFLKVLESFISFLKKYDAKKPIICFFMLNLRFKSLCFISSYIVYEGVAIVEKYDNRSLHPMFIKCHDHLHLVLKSKVDCANPTIEENHSLDILKQTTNTN